MDIFTTYLYQPFFNLLVGLYWLVGQIFPNPDMGIAMIFFAIAVRLIFLPIDMIGDRSDKDKFEISQKVKKLKIELASDPVHLKKEISRIMRQQPGAILSEIINVIFQAIIIIMLYRIFTTGLEGEDLHLLYSFMPKIQTPINLMFLGVYDLSHTNNTLNMLQSLMIAANESMHLYFSPVKPSRKDFVSLVILFPVFCFVIFMFLPAGKKIYIITSLAFTMIIRLIREILYLLYSFNKKTIKASSTNAPAGTK
ncbi:MAG TPA: YidC/Oxa1 family membrane protein insertase [Spirochaetia bacterium]|nr:YidC/Oxa1 family membrane protein insertase [Spirochaetia bacterium]